MITGFVGLFSLVIENWGWHRQVAIVTYSFGGVLVLCEIIVVRFLIWGTLEGSVEIVWQIILSFFTFFSILTVLYADWAIGAMTNNLSGAPTADNAVLYYTFFIVKRITMFCA